MKSTPKKSFLYPTLGGYSFYETLNEEEILNGVIDIHTHIGPMILPRRISGLELAKKAREAGMRALVYKPIREMSTIQMAKIIDDLVPGISVFGGVALNYEVGGLNPWAVKSAIDQDGKFIWMPVVDAERTFEIIRKRGNEPGIAKYKNYATSPKGISILDHKGELLPKVGEILDLIGESKEKGVVLDTAHIGPEEALVLAEEAKSRGIDKMVSGHMLPLLDYSMEEQKELIKKGVYLQYCCIGFMIYPRYQNETPDAHATKFKELGPENVIMSTDLGLPILPDPVEGMKEYILYMLQQGLSQHDVDLMTKKNPAKLLGLE